MPDCSIIGVLDNGSSGISREALLLIRQADLLVGNPRTLGLFATEIDSNAETKDISGSFAKIPGWVKTAQEQEKKVVVFATGDPLCHGIGKYLINRLGREQCQVIPSTSTLQLAFARLGLAWPEARIHSIHGKDLGEWHQEADASHGLYPLLQKIQQQRLLGIFTSRENSPGRIARMLDMVSLGDHYEMAVAERLLLPEEQTYDFMPIVEIKQRQFANPNIVILRPVSSQPSKAILSLADETDPLHQREIQAACLSQMRLHRDSIVWDIHAGAGSLGMEAAKLCTDGFIYALEHNSENAAIIRKNQQQYRITNYRLTQSVTPQGVAQWPDPDAIFIAGSEGDLDRLIETALARLTEGSWLVMNFTSQEKLDLATDQLTRLGQAYTLCKLQVSHSESTLEIQQPVWVLSTQKF